MILTIFKGIAYYLKAIPKIVTLNLWKYFLLLLLSVFIYFIPFLTFGSISLFFINLFPIKDGVNIMAFFYQFMISISGYALLLILSPFFSLISEIVFKKLNDNTYHFSIKQFISDILRGIKITIRNLIYQLFYFMIIYFILWFIPENNLIYYFFSIALILITSYFYGFTLLDYALENQRYNYKESLKFIQQNKGYTIGLGMVYYIAIHIEKTTMIKEILGSNMYIISIFIEAIILFVGVIAASIFVFDHIKNSVKSKS